MDSRTRLLETLRFSPKVPPPRYESEFSDEVVAAWRQQGVLGDESPEARLQLDTWDALPVEWRRNDEEKQIVHDEAELRDFMRAYDPQRADRLPPDWPDRVTACRTRESAIAIEPWNEGFFQVLGIRNGATLTEALTLLCERPDLAEAQMAHYADYVVGLIDRVLADADIDFAVFYEPIASNHGPVISPATYRRFVTPALGRVSECLDRHGVAFRLIWSAGRVEPLIPEWLDAGVNGFLLNRSAECGMPYTRLRREFGPSARFLGGIDWRPVVEGSPALERELEQNVRPLLEQGGYVPHLDDTVRVYMPFDRFRYYREQLDALVAQVFG